MALILRTGQSRPPLGITLNRSHPLARELSGCWLFRGGGGGIVPDLVARNHLTLANGAAQTVANRIEGMNTTADNHWAAGHQGGLMDRPETNNQLTLAMWVASNNTALTNKYALQYGNNGGAILFGYVARTYETYWSSGAARHTIKQLAANDNAEHMLVAILDGRNDRFRAYFDGVETLNAADLVDVAGFVGRDNFFVGSSEVNAAAQGTYSQVMVWSRALGASEVVSLYQDRYQMLSWPAPLFSQAAAASFQAAWGAGANRLIGIGGWTGG